MSHPKRPAVPADASRREFLRANVAAGLVAAVRPRAAAAQEPPAPVPAPAPPLYSAPPIERVRIGYVGVGERGSFECLRRGWPTDQNVYDAAAWSAISGLSEQSVAEGSRPVAVPDFTRGRWRSTPPLTLREA